MYFDFLLLSVVLMTAYLGPVVLRRRPPGQRAFAWLLIADGLCALIALIAPPGRGAGLLTTVALGAAVFLLFVPPVLRQLVRRALRADQPQIALWLIDFWCHLQPGMGVDRERELIEVLIAVKRGEVDTAIEALSAARAELSDPRARQHMDERIVATYLTARRWSDAIAVFEQRLDRDAPPAQIGVELVWAYCEHGDLSAAGDLVTRITAIAASSDDPMWHFLAHRARLMFLAFTGRVDAVEAALAADGPLHVMPAASQHFWSGMARLYAGDIAAARTALERAARLARGDKRARAIARDTLQRIDDGSAASDRERPSVPPAIAALADRFSAEMADAPKLTLRSVPQMQVPARAVPMTTALALANMLVFLAVYLIYDSAGDPGALVRAGANVKSWIGVGAPWRLTSSMFLHVGVVHLALNVYALWALGKLLEQTHGPLRMFAVYMLAGVCGALASAVYSGPGISAGASGAVLGLLGALIAEFTLHRKSYPQRWRSALLTPLIFIALAQIAIGFFYDAIDQWAHVAGLIVGAASAALLSRKSPWATRWPIRGLTAALALIGALALGYSAYGVLATAPLQPLLDSPRQRYQMGGLAFEAPTALSAAADNHVLADGVTLWLEATACPQAATTTPSELCLGAGDADAHREHAGERLRDYLHKSGAQLSAVTQPSVPSPPGWQLDVMRITQDGLGGVERYQLVIATQQREDAVWIVTAQMPAALADGVGRLLNDILVSTRTASPTP
ncbi:MAG: hypothetical protein Tsb0020_09970 [Haliangiales bacterium]